jgi:periplasmic protein TonB
MTNMLGAKTRFESCRNPLLRGLRGVVLAGVLGAAQAALAQFSMVPAPLLPGPPRESAAEIEREYRIDAARHIYAAYPMRVYRGKVPPLIYSVMMVETEIDATGQVINISVVRKPAADEVAPWVIAMIRRAAPFPPPSRMPGGKVSYTDIWLVDKSGLFQVDTLTEGQR